MAQPGQDKRSRTIAPMFFTLAALVLLFGIIALFGGNVSGFLLAVAFTIVFSAVGYYFHQVQPGTLYGTPEHEELRQSDTRSSEEPAQRTFQAPPPERPAPEKRPEDEHRP